MTKKPCPFCGSRGNSLLIEQDLIPYQDALYHVECEMCGAQGPRLDVDDDEQYIFETTTKTLAIKAWNKRD